MSVCIVCCKNWVHPTAEMETAYRYLHCSGRIAHGLDSVYRIKWIVLTPERCTGRVSAHESTTRGRGSDWIK